VSVLTVLYRLVQSVTPNSYYQSVRKVVRYPTHTVRSMTVHHWLGSVDTDSYRCCTGTGVLRRRWSLSVRQLVLFRRCSVILSGSDKFGAGLQIRSLRLLILFHRYGKSFILYSLDQPSDVRRATADRLDHRQVHTHP